jgi:CRP/FNR family transcriptional regulator, cyclic AMP receptor protein
VARDEYLQQLAAVPLFSKCTKQQLQEIARVADEVTVTPGTVLTRQGDVAFELFVILEGTASVVRDGQLRATVGRGGFVGELAVIAHTPRTATVTADTELNLLVLTATGLSQLLDDIPGLAKHLLFEVATRLAPTATDHSAPSHHHSELSEAQLARLSEVLRQLGATSSFSANEALSAALTAGVVNSQADIGTAIDDLEDAGVLRQVQKDPPRWEVVTASADPPAN